MDILDYLIKYLLEEKNEIYDNIPKDYIEKKKLYRALVNVREPLPISDEYLKAESKYLKEELDKEDITDVSNINAITEIYKNTNLKNPEKICLRQGDITKLNIDCIVNAGNSQGLGCFLTNHNCIDNQINTYAGVPLRLKCNEIMKLKDYYLNTSDVIITDGYNLPAKKIIQTVGPIIENYVTEEKINQLSNCYINSLNLAIDNNIKTIAFPCISTGVFRFPKDLASKIAINTVDEFISKNKNKLDKVVFNLWSNEDVIIYEKNIR